MLIICNVKGKYANDMKMALYLPEYSGSHGGGGMPFIIPERVSRILRPLQKYAKAWPPMLMNFKRIAMLVC